MKKILFLLTIGLLFNACKKEHEGQPEPTKKYKVTFKTQLFDQSIGDFKSGSRSQIFLDQMPTLYTRVYNLDNEGKKVDDYSTLAPGEYVAVFVASNHKFYRLSDFGEMGGSGGIEEYFEIAGLDTRYSFETTDIPLEDIFYKKLYFTVTNQDIDETVILNRIVSGLEVIFEDVLPATVSKLELTIEDHPNFYFYSDNTSGEVDKISSFGRVQRLTALVLGSGARTLHIRAYDSDENLIIEKSLVANFYANKKTTLSGKLFNDPGVLFTVEINSNWDTPPATIPF